MKKTSSTYNNLKSFFVFLSCIGLMVVSSDQSLAGEEITVFGNEFKPPKIYLENGEPVGILVDILRYVERKTTYTFRIELYPWKRAYSYAENAQGGIVGLSMTAERLNIFDYSDVVYDDEMLLVVKKGHEFPFETIEDLAGKVLGVRRGSIYGDVFERGMRELLFTVNEDGNGVQRLKKLLLDRIDVALIGPGKSGLNWIINSDSMLQASRDEFVVLPVPFAVDPNYLGFAQAMNMKEFLAEFNLIIQQGHEDGTIQAIIGKYEEYTSRLMR